MSSQQERGKGPNRFSHHRLSGGQAESCGPCGPCELVSPRQAAASEQPEQEDLSEVAQQLRDAGVAQIVLVHGTFAGNDIVGIVREIARFAPGVAARLSEIGKRWFDDLVGEVGNYADSFTTCLDGLINPPNARPIEITRFHWSGENHHLGRANGAMTLVDQIFSSPWSGDQRLLMLAHSHGGNLLAMMSQLLGADAEAKRRFFQATRLHYHSPVFGHTDLPTWQRVEDRLLGAGAIGLPAIDVATFGTPLRYRWDLTVCPHLLHFVQHRPSRADDPFKAGLPGSIQDLLDADGGDYVQQLGVAGTDFFPSIFAWRDWIVEKRMGKLLEPGTRRRDIIRKLQTGRRAAADGTTLLVDYPDAPDGLNRKLFGHGVYTCRPWIAFHLREIARRFYRDMQAEKCERRKMKPG